MSHSIKLLWLSFLTALLGETTFFILIDPQQVYLFGEPVPVSWPPMLVYSAGFFMFWSLTALTAALVSLMQKSSEEVNREPEVRAGHRRQKEPLRSA